MENVILQCALYLLVLAVFAWPLGMYMGKVMDGKPSGLLAFLVPCERALYRILGVNPTEQMGWKRYLGCLLAFSAVSTVILVLLLMVQHSLPLNPQGIPDTSWDLP